MPRTMRKAIASLALAPLLVLACAHESAQPSRPAAPAAPTNPATTSTELDSPPPPRADGRLPQLATPTHYAIALDVDPSKPRFSGHVAIDVDVPHATRFLVLHGRGIDVRGASATAGGKAIAGEATPRLAHGSVTSEEIVLAFREPLPAGKATIAIDYDAPFSPDLLGAYRVKEGDRWYAFTQFESTAARRAFPCFDEPAYKATFDVSIVAPTGSIAVANAPETKRSPQGTATRFEFARTPPISTYLVAFAVGDFDVREGSKSPLPIRLVTVKGKSSLGGAALDATDGLVRALGAYFGVPYPFEKLDIVAVPDFAAGAMENPGLITFREPLLLQDPAHTSTRAKRMQALVVAHELAHQWFGDLVTMQWWNDVWLNEGFATWMEAKVVDTWRPELGTRLDAVADAQGAMDQDALANARAVRQPVASTSEIEEAFDGISYEKGSAVLSMIEHWVGPETFQRGVRDYIRAHSWKNATADDLLGALDRASGRDVTSMAASFLDRPGVPSVAVKSTCTAGKVTFDLAQSAWRPLGVEAKQTDATPWRIPVCVSEAGAKRDACVDLAGPSGSLAADASTCPAWSYPNAGESGYYRWSLDADHVRAIAKNVAVLDVASRIGFVSNVWAQVRAGAIDPSVILEVLPAFDHETDGHVVLAVIDAIEHVDHALIDDTTRPAFEKWVAQRMAGHMKSLGWTRKPGEDDERTFLRPFVIGALGELARDAATLKQAEATAKAWLADPASVDADVAPIALRLASIHAGPARLDELRAAAAKAKLPSDRVTALSAFAAFDDEATLRRAFDLLLTDEVKMQDFRYVLGRGSSGLHERSARVFFQWMTEHWDALEKKLPGHLAGRLVYVVGEACSKDQRDAETAFFTPKTKQLEGSSRPFAESVERATSCSELRGHGAESVARFFRKGPPEVTKKG